MGLNVKLVVKMRYKLKLNKIKTLAANLNRLEGVCNKLVKSFFKNSELEQCKKLGAWQSRANGLLDTIGVMKKICLKMKQNGETMYG